MKTPWSLSSLALVAAALAGLAPTAAHAQGATVAHASKLRPRDCMSSRSPARTAPERESTRMLEPSASITSTLSVLVNSQGLALNA